METINSTWRPHKKSSNALIKMGYSQEQLNDIGKLFIERYWNKQVNDASSTFTGMVRSSGAGHNVKVPKSAFKEILKNKQEAEQNRAENGVERAQEAKEFGDSETLRNQKAQMTIDRFGTDRDEANQLFGIEG